VVENLIPEMTHRWTILAIIGEYDAACRQISIELDADGLMCSAAFACVFVRLPAE